VDNYCCFLPKDQSLPVSEIQNIVKTHNGAFIGIGYIFPNKEEMFLKEICAKASIPLIRMPMGQLDYLAYADSYKLDYLYVLKNNKELIINVLKNSLEETDPQIVQLQSEVDGLRTAIQKREKAEILRSSSAHANSCFEQLLVAPSEQDLVEEVRKISPGVATGYRIGDMELKLEGGEISVVAAPTGHGKTSFLINVLLGILRQRDTSVYLFSYEEARASVVCLALNSYIGEKLSANNRESIKAWFRDCTLTMPDGKRAMFLEKKNRFFQDLIQSRRLNIFYSSYTAEELALTIRFLATQSPRPTVICIDYMQLLRLGNAGKWSSRQEELKQICLLLKDCAVETGLPILIAAQFNRSVQSECAMVAQAIGEAGDIERIAALILGLWNRRFNQERSDEALFVRVLKGRTISSGLEELFDFNGNTCTIANKVPCKTNDLF
jgi:replicative DNA helicase